MDVVRFCARSWPYLQNVNGIILYSRLQRAADYFTSDHSELQDPKAGASFKSATRKLVLRHLHWSGCAIGSIFLLQPKSVQVAILDKPVSDQL